MSEWGYVELEGAPRSELVTRGDRAFSVMGPKLWNKLPITIKSATTVESFKATLKTHLFTNP